ncbi:MAG TPA: F420-dependent NADP oxidoreductase [Prolixibacteraceae bacterium]|nr:F420-dependent NADP oxidoreductase [Prolixibacteraceae bacterium]
MIQNAVIIGAGNLATQLAMVLFQKGITVQQVYSRTIERAMALAQKVNDRPTSELSEVEKGADIYVIAVKDSAIEEVLKGLTMDKTSLVVHTAGSIPMEVLAPYTGNYGVFYPLQTFSVTRQADFSDIPICMEASNPEVMEKLEQLGYRISSSVHSINSEERKTLHLSAVFVNNFVNHFYVLGAEILSQKGLDFNLLKPLIRETAQKVEIMHPLNAQTGPARRMDEQVIGNHLKMLEAQPEWQKIYSFVTESIYLHQFKIKNKE